MTTAFENSVCVAFTGHRAIRADLKAALPTILDRTLSALYEEGYRVFYNGGAVGFDLIAADAVLRLRELHPDVKLILALPGAGQTDGWKWDDITRYQTVLNAADERIYPAGVDTVVSRETFLERDRYMIEHASVCVCYLTQVRGGTVYTVNRAKKAGLRVINVAEEAKKTES